MDTLIGGSLNKPKNKGFNGYFAPEKKKKQPYVLLLKWTFLFLYESKNSIYF